VLLPIRQKGFWPSAHWECAATFLALEENFFDDQGWHSTMKRIALLNARQAPAASTGAHCPASGLWTPDESPQESHMFFEGQVLPAYQGAPTVWRRRPGGQES
jgi:hypothetical protein